MSYRICHICEYPHYENCDNCFGFGEYEVADKPYERFPLPAGWRNCAERYRMFYPCDLCGSESIGVPGIWGMILRRVPWGIRQRIWAREFAKAKWGI